MLQLNGEVCETAKLFSDQNVCRCSSLSLVLMVAHEILSGVLSHCEMLSSQHFLLLLDLFILTPHFTRTSVFFFFLFFSVVILMPYGAF